MQSECNINDTREGEFEKAMSFEFMNNVAII